MKKTETIFEKVDEKRPSNREKRNSKMTVEDAKNLIKRTMPKGNSAIDIMLREALNIAIDALEDCTPIRLPLMVGDVVYRPWGCGKNGKSIAEFKVVHVDIDRYPEITFEICGANSRDTYRRKAKISDIGKTIFLSKKAALLHIKNESVNLPPTGLGDKTEEEEYENEH